MFIKPRIPLRTALTSLSSDIEVFSLCAFFIWGFTILSPVYDSCSYQAFDSTINLASEFGLFMVLAGIYQLVGLVAVGKIWVRYLPVAIFVVLLGLSTDIFIEYNIYSAFGYVYLAMAVLQAVSYYWGCYYKMSIYVTFVIWTSLGVVLTLGGSIIYGLITIILGLSHIFVLVRTYAGDLS